MSLIVIIGTCFLSQDSVDQPWDVLVLHYPRAGPWLHGHTPGHPSTQFIPHDASLRRYVANTHTHTCNTHVKLPWRSPSFPLQLMESCNTGANPCPGQPSTEQRAEPSTWLPRWSFAGRYKVDVIFIPQGHRKVTLFQMLWKDPHWSGPRVMPLSALCPLVDWQLQVPPASGSPRPELSVIHTAQGSFSGLFSF